MAGPANFGASGSYFGMFDGTNAPTITYKEKGGGSATARKLQAVSATWKVALQKEVRRNPNGKKIGTTVIGGVITLSLELVVEADTVANTVAHIRPPIEMTEVVLADFISNDNTFLNGTYSYEDGASLAFTQGGQAKLNLELMQDLDADLSVITGLLTPIT
jgi:hypothetical protein